MAYIVMTYIVVASILMACIFMAYVVMAKKSYGLNRAGELGVAEGNDRVADLEPALGVPSLWPKQLWPK